MTPSPFHRLEAKYVLWAQKPRKAKLTLRLVFPPIDNYKTQDHGKITSRLKKQKQKRLGENASHLLH